MNNALKLLTAATADDQIYEDRYVAFIDILGFKNLVENKQVYKILQSFEQVEKLKNQPELEFSGFSDSIILSVNANNAHQPEQLINFVGFFARELLNKDILCRGGITRGKLFHQGNVCFGPALLEAYEMESKTAIFPRILVSDKVVGDYKRQQPELGKEIIRNSCDGLQHIDILTPYLILNPTEGFYVKFYLTHPRSFIEKEIAELKKLAGPTLTEKGTRILDKLEWMLKYIDTVDTKYGHRQLSKFNNC